MMDMARELPGRPLLIEGTSVREMSVPNTVEYTLDVSAESVTIRTDSGSMALANGFFAVRDAADNLLARAALWFRVDEFVFPVATEIDHRRAVLTPQFDLTHAAFRPLWWSPEDPFARRRAAAYARLATTLRVGATIDVAVGFSRGAVGCRIGGKAGAAIPAAAFGGLAGSEPIGYIPCIDGIPVPSTRSGRWSSTSAGVLLPGAQYFTRQ